METKPTDSNTEAIVKKEVKYNRKWLLENPQKAAEYSRKHYEKMKNNAEFMELKNLRSIVSREKKKLKENPELMNAGVPLLLSVEAAKNNYRKIGRPRKYT